MPISVSDYADWIYDAANDEHRLWLVEIDYSDNDSVSGHGRYSDVAAENLNPVQSMTLDSYTSNLVEVQFVQPTSQEGYTWSVWIDGNLHQNISTGGVFSFFGIEGKTYQIAIASERGAAYSKPFVVDYTHDGTEQTISGAQDTWANIGEGALGTGGGTLYLSWPTDWLSDTDQVYDDFISDDFYIEKSVNDFDSIGSFKAINADTNMPWNTLFWRGHECRLLHGDDRWPREQFLPVARNIVEDARQLGGKEYSFDLLDSGLEYRRPYGINSGVLNTSVFQLMAEVAQVQNLPDFGLFGLGPKTSHNVEIEITESTTVESIVRSVADSVNGVFRTSSFSLNGQLVSKPETLFFTFDRARIIKDTVVQRDIVPAYKNVILEKADGSQIAGITSASTGVIRDTITIKTLLTNTQDCTEILAEYVEHYSKPRPIYAVQIYEPTGFLYTNSIIGIDVDELSGNFRVLSLQHWPMKALLTVEIEAHYGIPSEFTATTELYAE